MNTIFRALKFKNFRIFYFGQSVSLIGTWMQQIAVSWLVYRLTTSAFMLGLVNFATQIPLFLFSAFAGVFVDRYNRKSFMLITQILLMLQALTFGILTHTGAITINLIIVLGIILGLINSCDMPVRQSIVYDLIDDKELIGNAIALNSIMFNASRLIGNSIPGFIIAASGEDTCFFINAATFLTIIISLSMIKILHNETTSTEQNVFASLKEGIKYAMNSLPIRYILILLSMTSLLGMSYMVIVPIVAKEILGGGPQTLGFLMSSTGFGALIGALFLASRKNIKKLENIIPFSSLLFGCALLLFGLSKILWFSMVAMMLVGFGIIAQVASSNTLLQAISDDDKRGRIMSFYSMAFLGTAPIGSLIAGSIAHIAGAPATLIGIGSCIIVCSILFYFKLPKLKKSLQILYEKNNFPPTPSML